MLIGEVAALAGVSTRTVRHYHQVGVLPEPARGASGYREYGLRDVLRLVRAVRLAETGLSLPEVADALRDETGAELRSVLEELLRDIDAQQALLDARRRGVQAMLAHDDDLRMAHLARMPPAIVAAVGSDPTRLERERLAWETIAAALPPAEAESVARSMQELLSDPALVAESAELTARFEALADLDPDDPEVAEVAGRMAAIGRSLPDDDEPLRADHALYRAYLATLPPAQRRCLELVEQATS
jgi:DNA-binding transcriptional MerR regulator